jgi:hypothetical protein
MDSNIISDMNGIDFLFEVSEDSMDTMEYLLNVLKISNQESNTFEVEEGAACRLTKMLYSELCMSKIHDTDSHESKLQEEAIRLSMTCTVLEKILNSDIDLSVSLVDLIKAGIVPMLRRFVDIFLSMTLQSETIRDVALSKAAKIFHLISKHMNDFQHDIISPVQKLILHTVLPSDVRIDAACTVAILLAHHHYHHQNQLQEVSRDLQLLETKLAPIALTILSTAAGSASFEELSDISRAMLHLARNSQICLERISTRRDTLLNIIRLLDTIPTQLDALKLCALLFNCEITLSNLMDRDPSTALLLIRGLSKIAQVTINQDPNKDLSVAILMSLYDSENCNPYFKRVVHNVVLGVAYSTSSTPQLRADIAFGVCRQLLKKGNMIDQEAKELYPTVIDFLQFPLHSIRMEALFTLEVCTWNVEAAEILTSEYAFVDGVTVILRSKNNDMENDLALCIIFNCSKYDVCKNMICADANIISALVEQTISIKLTTISPISLPSLEIIFNLMKKKQHRICFKEFHDLIPWLATAVEITKSDDLKKKIVRTISQLSLMYLETGVPNRFMI